MIIKIISTYFGLVEVIDKVTAIAKVKVRINMELHICQKGEFCKCAGSINTTTP
jgi:hypothetical protein